MNSNIFEEIKQKKDSFKSYIEKAQELKWISNIEAEEFTSKIENDKLTLGVIGQMKCGKSTFLNALLFKEEVLPAATTPMTASLSIITYGEKKKLEVEFYSLEDWQELKFHAARSIEEAGEDETIKSKIKAAKELYEKSLHLGNSITSLLGTKKVDDFDKLIDYVGADGKYVAITKTVRIEYPLEYLKGVEVVDTPGFNDPIVSREERTKEFLKKADAVLMLLYAGRAFDATDKDIIFNKVGSIGVGKVLLGVNKYDLCYANGETREEILSNIKKQLKEASTEYPRSTISELIHEHEPLLLSANMALMAQMDLSKVMANENLDFYYKKALDDFEIQTQSQLYEMSLMNEFEKAIKQVIIDSKTEILIKKPLNFIKQKGEQILGELNNRKTKLENNLVILNKPDGELEDLLRNIEKVKKRYNRKLEGFEINVTENIHKNIKQLTFDVQDTLAKTKTICYNKVDDSFVVIKLERIQEQIIRELEAMERKLDKDFTITNDNLNYAIKSLVNAFILDLEDLMERFLDDFESEDFVDVLQKHFSNPLIAISFTDLIESEEEEEKSLLTKGLELSGQLINHATFGILDSSMNVVDGKRRLKDWIEYLYGLINLELIQESMIAKGNQLIFDLKKDIEGEFLNPIENQTKNILNQEQDKAKNIELSQIELIEVKSQLSSLEIKYEQMNILSLNIV